MNTDERRGCLGLILNLFGGGSQKTAAQKLCYQLHPSLLTPAELAFFQVLQVAVRDWAVICPKVRLADLFFPKSGDRSTNVSLRNRIDRKHVDYVLCDPRTMRPLLAIELDDRSHQRADRRQRDEFVNQLFADTGLPLVRVPVGREYELPELAKRLCQTAGVPIPELAPAESTQSDRKPAAPHGVAGEGKRPHGAASCTLTPPACPKCGQQMVLRTVRRAGPHQGKQFWGCADYPRCRGVREYKDRVVRENEPDKAVGMQAE